jgi:carboxyl-terminal processing protease
LTRRLVRGLAAPLVLACGLAFGGPASLSAREALEDYDAACRAIEADYAFLAERRAGWTRARAAGRARAAATRTPEALAAVIESTLGALRDDQVSVRSGPLTPSRRVPAETDLWGEWREGRAVITAVRPSSAADVAGLRPGLEVRWVQGVPVERIVRERLGGHVGSGDERDWALRHVLAGPRTGSYRIGIREGAATKPVEVVRTEAAPGNAAPVLSRRVSETRDVGYLRLSRAPGDEALVAAFDAALKPLQDTRGLLLDLRDFPAEGSDEVARALLGRFLEKPVRWQVREPRRGPAVEDVAQPRGPFAYRAPVVVLVDRWTAGAAESLATALAQHAGATLVGTATAGYRGVVRTFSLPRSGVVIAFPAERVLTAAGRPREALRPAVPVDLAAPSGGPGDPILYQGLKRFEK